MQPFSQVSGRHFQTPLPMTDGLSYSRKNLAFQQKPWHQVDDHKNLRKEIFSQIIMILKRRGVEKNILENSKDVEINLYYAAASKEEYGDLGTLEQRVISYLEHRGNELEQRIWRKFQMSTQQAQLGSIFAKPSGFNGNIRNALIPGSQGNFNMINVSAPFLQGQNGGSASNFGMSSSPLASQTTLHTCVAEPRGEQCKPGPSLQKGGSWMIPTPGLNITNTSEPARMGTFSEKSNDLMCNLGSGLDKFVGDVMPTNDSTTDNLQLGNMETLNDARIIRQEQEFSKDNRIFNSPNFSQNNPALLNYSVLPQPIYGITPTEKDSLPTSFQVESNSFNNPTFSTGFMTPISSSEPLPEDSVPSQYQDLKPSLLPVSECGTSTQNAAFSVLPAGNGLGIPNQYSIAGGNSDMQYSFEAFQGQYELRGNSSQLKPTSESYENQNPRIEVLDGHAEGSDGLRCEQQKSHPSHEEGSNVDAKFGLSEKACQATSADTAQSEVVSSDDAPNQVKEVGNVLSSQQVKRQQWLLIFLRHVSRCTGSHHCNVVHCAVGREVWNHLISCRCYPCPYPRCMPLKSLLSHHQKCRSRKCPICGPVRAATMRTKLQKRLVKQHVRTVRDLSSHEVDSSPAVKRIKVEVVKRNANQADNQSQLESTIDSTDDFNHHASKTVPKSKENECTMLSMARIETLEKGAGVPFQKADSPIESSVSEGSQLPSKSLPSNDMKQEFNPINKNSSIQVTNSHNVQDVEKLNKQTSVANTVVPCKSSLTVLDVEKNNRPTSGITITLQNCKSSSDSGNIVKSKISGISYVENFSPEQIRQHITSLRKWIGQSKCKAERNQAMQRQMSTSACSACAVEDLYFDPIPNFCTQCGCRIKRNATYYSTGAGENNLSFCGPCYSAIRHDTVETYGSKFQKSMLLKKKNDEQRAEGWVECDKCKKWQHQICVLFNARMNKERSEYVCPDCCIMQMERGERLPRAAKSMPGAKDLPRTVLSDFVQERLTLKLNQERAERAQALGKSSEEVPTAEGLVVRVLSSVDKKLDVKPKFLELFLEENYPKEFYYKSKMLMLFQDIEGVEVCLFGMYVQEFGADSPQPNSRWVYLSYLDSIKYFRPDVKTVRGEALRTFVYHEILIAYLDFCKKRGFSSCYIWACPPLKGDDYILYCHPEIQKTPKTDKLREWYINMISKAKREKIVVCNKNLYDYFFTSTGDCKAKVTATRLPYFDGDYWPGAAEDILHQLQQDDASPQSQKSKSKKMPPKRTTKTSAHAELGGNTSLDLQLMHKLGQSIVAMKEDFIIVHLHHACSRCRTFIYSGVRWVCRQCAGNFQLCSSCYEEHELLEDEEKHPAGKKELHHLWKEEVEEIPVDTTDKDEIMESEFFDNRQAFLSLCQGNQYQFDTLRRAKHSSMMVLYHLHNPSAPAFITSCTICHSEIEEGQGFKCKICTDFDVCHGCYSSQEVQNHPHKLVARSSGTEPTADDRKQRVLQVRMMLEVLVHASKCCEASCQFAKCRNIKDLFRHGQSCAKRAAGGCAFCKRMWFLLTAHARGCKETICSVPRCMDIRKHLKRAQLQQESRRRAAVNEMIRQRAAEAAGTQ